MQNQLRIVQIPFHQDHIQLKAGELTGQIMGVIDSDVRRTFRMLLDKRPQHLRQHVIADGVASADMQAATEFSVLLKGLLYLVRALQQLIGHRQQTTPLAVQMQAIVDAVKQTLS